MKRCRYEGRWVPDDEAVMIGATERPSGPSLPMYACLNCVDVLHILPMTDHPEGSDGLPRTRDGQPLIEIHQEAS